MRFWLLLIVARLLGGGRWFPVHGHAVLILRGAMSMEHGERLQAALAPSNVRVVVLPAHVEVQGVISQWS